MLLVLRIRYNISYLPSYTVFFPIQALITSNQINFNICSKTVMKIGFFKRPVLSINVFLSFIYMYIREKTVKLGYKPRIQAYFFVWHFLTWLNFQCHMEKKVFAIKTYLLIRSIFFCNFSQDSTLSRKNRYITNIRKEEKNVKLRFIRT